MEQDEKTQSITVTRAHIERAMSGRLIDMDFAEACRVKWERGMIEHGVVMQVDPLIEMFSEFVDIRNYCMAASQIHSNPSAQATFTALMVLSQSMASTFQELVHALEKLGKKYVAQTIEFKPVK